MAIIRNIVEVDSDNILIFTKLSLRSLHQTIRPIVFP